MVISMSILRQVKCCFLRESSPHLYRQSIRTFKLKPPGNRSHYDSLGVTPSATQSDIKSAYYKLSKLYHPDRNKGSEIAANHFKTINEAYEILGNFKKRRLYDKGIPMGSNESPMHHEAPEEMDAQTRFYRSRGSAPSGKTPIYDFDEWSRAHYGATLKRREAAKTKYDRKMQGKVDIKGELQKETVIYFSVLLVMLFSLLHYVKDRRSYDVDRTTTKESKDSGGGS